MLDRLRRFTTTPQQLRRAAISAIVANAAIVVTGGAVRLSDSGLGCPTWPSCTGDRVLPGGANPHPTLNQAIEFGNRMLGFVVFAAVLACVIAAWRLRPQRPGLLKLSLLLPLGVLAQGILGGITVRMELNPFAVAPHFLLSVVLIYVCVWFFVRATEGDGPPERLIRRDLQRLAALLVAVLGAVTTLGTVVTATGPHAGDPGTRRLSWDPHLVTQFHSGFVFLYVGIVLALLVAFRVTAAPAALQRRTVEVFAIACLQGVIGFVQYFLHVPEVLVGLHMAGATLLTIATARLYFATRVRRTATVAVEVAV